MDFAKDSLGSATGVWPRGYSHMATWYSFFCMTFFMKVLCAWTAGVTLRGRPSSQSQSRFQGGARIAAVDIQELPSKDLQSCRPTFVTGSRSVEKLSAILSDEHFRIITPHRPRRGL
jgi:hypothetical protein